MDYMTSARMVDCQVCIIQSRKHNPEETCT